MPKMFKRIYRLRDLENRIDALEDALLDLAFEQNVEFEQPITRQDLKKWLKKHRIIEE